MSGVLLVISLADNVVFIVVSSASMVENAIRLKNSTAARENHQVYN